MAGAPTIWVSGDMSEQISDFNGEYTLILISSKQRISLGKSLEAARKKLKELGREDIANQLR
ncbi:hypothetical protein [Sporomusa sphaeroides]|uniref:Uncharacterized protein n=1 Tax=Sporomusa sphaeroides DSM 2875 TaxID=1337886 RepID=A0ABM9VXS9_9FIRM|nr:hypothetical protein [Sporomusa sphaeroides]OLS58343.1 hypothetical protein SPSPH_18810 [Sporomusa sphaeroides DSM 2875]CVK17470.1 hypothetical protein SSPH_00102 [Sporomusa sphaeroides DSM 2875]